MNKVKRNFFFGFRSSKSLLNDENWYKINHYGARQFMRLSIILFIFGVVCFFIPISESNKDVMSLLEGVLPYLIFFPIPIVKIILFSQKL